MSRLLERRFLIRSAASLALLGVLLWRVDLDAAAHALRDANYLYVIPALIIFGIAKLLAAQRWRMMMSKFVELPLAPCTASCSSPTWRTTSYRRAWAT